MEEILASIRRIIADDQSLPGNRREREERRRRDVEVVEAAPPASHDYSEPALEAASAEVEEDVVDAIENKPSPPPALAEIRHLRLSRAVEQAPPVDVEESDLIEDEEEDFSASYDRAEEPVADEPLMQEALISSSTASSVASHFEALAASVFLNDEGMLRQYAQEMMRPMLKQWLDDNLPTIVERLVRAEIERVARGGRRYALSDN
jgi:cell pole-organizing protein PopZ